MITTLDYIVNTSDKLFLYTDPRIKILYDYLIDICKHGNKNYYNLKTKYHNVDHFLSSSTIFVNIYTEVTKNSILKKNKSDFFCGVVATLYHDIGFIKNKSEKRGTGAQYIDCHVERGCEFINKNLSIHLTEHELEIICKLIQSTDYFKPNYNVNYKQLGACVALADWLSQLSDEQYVDKLNLLYKEYDEYQTFNKINLYSSFSEMIHKTPMFWYQTVKPMFNEYYYNLHELSHCDYICKIETNIDLIVHRYNVTNK